MADSGSNYHCCVPYCNGDARYNKDLVFHRIPRNAEARKAWIHAIRRDEGPLFKITDCTRVCSAHFKKEDYRTDVFGPKRGKILKEGRYPSQFDWSKTTFSRTNVKDKIRSRSHPSSMSHSTSDDETINSMDVDVEVVELTPEQENLSKKTPTELVLLLADRDKHIKQLTQDLSHAQDQINNLQSRNTDLTNKVAIERFGIHRYTYDNKLIKFYTGFTNYGSLYSFFNYIRCMADTVQTAYYVASQDISQAGRRSCLLLEDEMFMFLCRLCLGLQEQDLAERFHCSVSTVSRKIITWSNLLYFILGSFNIWLPRGIIERKLPTPFKNTKYSQTRVIIDCTEIKVQMPTSLVLNSQTYSSYKSANTLKCLIGIAPHGAVTFISSLYTGCMSDVEITRICGILDLLEEGDVVMADKGFTIQKDCELRKASLNIPPFLSQNSQFTPSQVSETQEIATLRIHVERAIQRVKDYNLFKSVIPLNMVGTVCQLWTVAGLLTNFQGPLIIDKI